MGIENSPVTVLLRRLSEEVRDSETLEVLEVTFLGLRGSLRGSES